MDEGGGDLETGRSGLEWINAKLELEPELAPAPVLELAIAPGSGLGPRTWETGGEVRHQTMVDSQRFPVLSK